MLGEEPAVERVTENRERGTNPFDVEADEHPEDALRREKGHLSCATRPKARLTGDRPFAQRMPMQGTIAQGIADSHAEKRPAIRSVLARRPVGRP
jgi:hypothetical protein